MAAGFWAASKQMCRTDAESVRPAAGTPHAHRRLCRQCCTASPITACERSVLCCAVPCCCAGSVMHLMHCHLLRHSGSHAGARLSRSICMMGRSCGSCGHSYLTHTYTCSLFCIQSDDVCAVPDYDVTRGKHCMKGLLSVEH